MNQSQLTRLVLVRRPSRLDELAGRFNTLSQAQFYIRQNGLDFDDYQREHDTYKTALARVAAELDALTLPGRGDVRLQMLDRQYLPNFVFDGIDAVVVVGQDGLVANTAKYVGGRPIIGVNPDPKRYDGQLLAWRVGQAASAVTGALNGRLPRMGVTLAEACLNDGQRLLAFNELLVGRRDHVSARYTLRLGSASETHSSSGVMIATGAGSTGWLSSVRNMAMGVEKLLTGTQTDRTADRTDTQAPPWGELPAITMPKSDDRLVFVVREPFASRTTGTALIAGYIRPGESLRVESLMPEGGVIFSDGLDSDGLAFNSGAVATIKAADVKVQLVLPS